MLADQGTAGSAAPPSSAYSCCLPSSYDQPQLPLLFSPLLAQITPWPPLIPFLTNSLWSSEKLQDIPSEHLSSQSGRSSGSTAIRSPTMTSGGTGAAHNTPTPSNRPASPSGSLYAMSDDEEGEYNTITHQESGKGVKLLFSKSKVRSPAALPKYHFEQQQ